MIKKWDIILIAALLAASFIPEGIFLLGGNSADHGGTYAVIQVDGTEYKTVPLSEHRGTDTFTVRTESGYNTVVVRDQEIGIVEADCPDKICIGEGFISQPGATTVCLPHKVLIEVRSSHGGEPDVIPAR
ncbi:NusG domain II-containing protein [Megasphaera hexanoica]|uniref:NusG domain II-containing protein n=1 Tax=uncultured Megasphaera sp. TaxID=165188 RepID=UPI00259741BA|nr:NusG domain II-containing protein [uncultured Megasphaera sp.]MDN0047021.1 NusG domain II-containing protein [Megasphaera hexanoica]